MPEANYLLFVLVIVLVAKVIEVCADLRDHERQLSCIEDGS